MKLIEILPNIYGVKVPFDAICSATQADNAFHISSAMSEPYILALNAPYKILGTLTKDEISFDASDVVESTEIDIEQYDGIFVATPRFWDYELESFSCSSSDESFRSALPEEIVWSNELPKPMHPICDSIMEEGLHEMYKNELKSWQTAKEKITQKLLILERL